MYTKIEVTPAGTVQFCEVVKVIEFDGKDPPPPEPALAKTNAVDAI